MLAGKRKEAMDSGRHMVMEGNAEGGRLCHVADYYVSC